MCVKENEASQRICQAGSEQRKAERIEEGKVGEHAVWRGQVVGLRDVSMAS